MNDDSARILAAAGWQSDPRRLPVLRELLREHLLRIYLYAYEESRKRATAIDRTRRTLMHVARTMQSIPAGCPFVTWVFLALEESRIPPVESPDLWRLLVIAEKERGAEQSHPSNSREGGTESGPNAHPMIRPLVSLHRRFLDLPGPGDIDPRAGWPAAQTDLECFLIAQFGETGEAECANGPLWRRWLVTRPWRRPRNIAAAAIAVVVITIGFVVGFTIMPPKVHRTTFLGSARPPSVAATPLTVLVPSSNAERAASDTGTAPGNQGAGSSSPTAGSGMPSARCPILPAQPAHGLTAPGRSLVRINGARCEVIGGDSIRFAWMPASAATEYRLCLITAKRDTLGVVPAISGTCVTVPVAGVPRMVVPGSFIFRVDGLDHGRVLATSDPQPFSVP